MKKKVLLSSILSIVLCLTMISGATFALFTDSETVNVAVTAGKVDIDVTVDSIQTTSREQNGAWDEDLLFTNGGQVTYNKAVANKVTLSTITPGDAVKLNLRIDNSSNVNIKYRVKVGLVSGVKLFQAMNVSVDDVAAEYNGATFVSQWYKLDAVTETTKVDDITVVIALPYLTAEQEIDQDVSQNDLMGESTELYYTVEAVQGNASDEDLGAVEAGVTYIYSPIDLMLFAENVNNGNPYTNETVKLMNDVDLAGIDWTPIGTQEAPFAGAFDGNGKTVSNLSVKRNVDYAGMFGYAAATASISNFTIENAAVSTSGYYAGAALAYSNGAVTISDITVTGDVKISAGALYAGGIVGCSASAKMTNCTLKGEDGSYIKSNRWAGGISGYDNGAYTMSGCCVENVTIESIAYVGGLAGLGGVGYNKTQSPEIFQNSVEDVTLVVTSDAAASELTYGAYLGGVNLYSYSKKPIILYDNTYANVTCTVNNASVDVQEMGSKYPDGTDKGLVIVPSMKVGNGYYSFLKPAFVDAPKDGTAFVIELVGDSMFTSNVKPSVAAGQNIVIKTNGYKLLFVESDTNGAMYNDDGTLKTTVVTTENMGSYITIKKGGTLVIE